MTALPALVPPPTAWNMVDDPKATAPAQHSGLEQEPMADSRTELLRQIRRALILEGGLSGDEDGGGGDPYNSGKGQSGYGSHRADAARSSHDPPVHDRWGPRRRG